MLIGIDKTKGVIFFENRNQFAFDCDHFINRTSLMNYSFGKLILPANYQITTPYLV